MSGKKSRTKGKNYELEIAKAFKAIGYKDAARQLEFQTDQANGIDLRETGMFAVQCKRYNKYAPIAKIEEVKLKEGQIPILATRADNKISVVCMYLNDFIPMAMEYKKAKKDN